MNRKQYYQFFKTKKWKRMIAKTLSWELSGVLILYILTGSLITSLWYFMIRFFLYYFHEIIWNKTHWGK